MLHQGDRESARVPQLVMLCRRWAQLQFFAGRNGRTVCYCVARKRSQYRNIRPFQKNLRSQILVLSPYSPTASTKITFSYNFLLRSVMGTTLWLWGHQLMATLLVTLFQIVCASPVCRVFKPLLFSASMLQVSQLPFCRTHNWNIFRGTEHKLLSTFHISPAELSIHPQKIWQQIRKVGQQSVWGWSLLWMECTSQFYPCKTLRQHLNILCRGSPFIWI